MKQSYVQQRTNEVLQKYRLNKNSNQENPLSFIKPLDKCINQQSTKNNENTNKYSIKDIFKYQNDRDNVNYKCSKQNQNNEEMNNEYINQTQRVDKSIYQNTIIIGNSHEKAIICFNTDQGILFGLDQHAIHERIRYEYFSRLFKQYLNKSQINQECLINPESINLSRKNQNVQYPSIINFDQNITSCLDIDKQLLLELQNSVDKLNQYGIKIIKITNLNNQLFKIYLWPQIFILHEPIEYEIKFLKEIISSNSNAIPSAIDTVLMFKACKGAIKFNESLTKEQMNILVQNIQQCEFPFHCVHGRSSIHTFFNLEAQNICQIQKSIHL